MWIVRYRIELLLLCVGSAFLALGLDLPPPIGRTIERSGQVSNLEVWSRQLTFSVDGTEFTAVSGGGGWKKFRGRLRNGLPVHVEGWKRILGGPAAIIHLETDAGVIVTRKDFLVLSWLYSVVLSGAGLLNLAIAVRHLRLAQPIAGFLRAQELAQPVPAPMPAARERALGAGQAIGGLFLLYSPILYALWWPMRGLAGLVFVVVPFVGLYFALVGSHRLIFGRPMTVHDSVRRRFIYLVAFGAFILASFIALALGLAFAWFHAR